jgi:hypothetical protein
MQADQLEDCADSISAFESRLHPKGREIGEFEHAVVSKKIDASVDRAVEMPKAIKKFRNEFAAGQH